MSTLENTLKQLRLSGLLAFRALGADAKDAVPKLIDMYDRKSYENGREIVADALGGIGPPASNAIPSLLRTLTNTGWFGNSLRALGEIHSESAMVVPALIKLLKDPDQGVRNRAIVDLQAFGAAARPAVPALIESLTDQADSVRKRATQALKTIDPEAAAKAGVQYRTREGSIWRDTSIARILECPSAKGVYFFNRMRQTGTWRVELKPESDWGRTECPPIIPEELWNQANQIMEEQLKAWKKPGKAPTHLFSGLAYCSCGSKMYVNSRTPKYFCRKCNNKIPIVDLENIMREELKGFFSEPDRIGKHLAEANRNLTDKTALLDAHRGEIQKIKDEIAKTHRLYLADQISAEGFGAIAKPAEERLGQLQTELPKLEAEVDFLRVDKLSADDVMHESKSMYERWPTFASGDKRKIMEALVEKVTIGNGEIDITFSCVPSSEDVCKSQQRLEVR